MNEGILGGLKHAVAKGESLKQAMMSFYNAGYKKEEIEEAAKVLQQQGMPEKITSVRPEIKSEFVQKSPQRVSAYGEISQSEVRPKEESKQEEQFEKTELVKTKFLKSPSQKVSDYEGKPKGKLILILLISFLLFLVATLFAVILFRRELIEFFNQLS